MLVEGGTGDLQQRARPGHVAPASLLRLDERVDVHRVSLAKKAVARLRISTSSRSRRFSRRSSASSLRSAVVRPLSWRVPASRCACLTHSRTAVSVRSKSLATWPTDRSPCWHSSTISALNSGVNERRRRGFLPTLSMVGHPSGGEPLMMDVRQSGSGPSVTDAAKIMTSGHFRHMPVTVSTGLIGIVDIIDVCRALIDPAHRSLPPQAPPSDRRGTACGPAPGEYIVTGGGPKGQRGFFTRDHRGRIAGADVAGGPVHPRTGGPRMTSAGDSAGNFPAGQGHLTTSPSAWVGVPAVVSSSTVP